MNYYLCPTESRVITSKRFYPLGEILTIDYSSNSGLSFKVDEHVFLLQRLEEQLLPYEFSIASINRVTRTLVLRVVGIYQNALPLAALAILLPEPVLHTYVQLTSQQFNAISSLMNVIPLDHSSDSPSEASKLSEASQAYEPSELRSQESFLQALDRLVNVLREAQEKSITAQDLSIQRLDSLENTLQALQERSMQSLDGFLRMSQIKQEDSISMQKISVQSLDQTVAILQKFAVQFYTMAQQSLQERKAAAQEEKRQEISVPGLDNLTLVLQDATDQLSAIMQGVNTLLNTLLQERRASTTIIKEEPEEYQVGEPENVEDDDNGGGIFEETEVLDYVRDYIRQRGYYFENETLYNYHICLKTRPFVILAGLSGTGKSKLAQLYAEALGQDETFKRLPVRPNWNDDRYLLGHLNTVTGEYITEPAVEFILAAIANKKKLYSLCLDEMNLAHVEYYFSQFLSAMEGDSAKDRRISLMSQRALEQLHELQRGNGRRSRLPPAEIYLPDNLVFTGTINVDETTQPISDKVIDRANTIEFFNVDLDSIPAPGDPGQALLITNRAWQSYRASAPDRRYRPQIIEISKILKQADMGLGYRVVHEMELYLANSQGLLEPQVAFDLQCKQRILPRIHGTEFIMETLSELVTFSKKNKLVRTEQRLQEMKSRLKRDGYTSFWR
ncbi:MAG: hypothetical protein PVS3B1_18000 [Ktedonobacteraceae bacterium]